VSINVLWVLSNIGFVGMMLTVIFLGADNSVEELDIRYFRKHLEQVGDAVITHGEWPSVECLLRADRLILPARHCK
jgi:hypothetical protein